MAEQSRKNHGKDSPAGKAKSKARTSAPDRSQANGAAAPQELIEMDDAIALLKTSRSTFYRWLRTGKIRGMKLGRQWRFYREDIERFLKGEEPRIELRADIGPLIATLSARIRELGGERAPAEEQGEVERAVRHIIHLAVLMRASDIHITPHLPASDTQVVPYLVDRRPRSIAALRYRIDGVLHRIAEIDMRLLPAIAERWKTLAACNIRETVRPQDGRILLDVAKKQLDIWVSFLPAAHGESITAHILDSNMAAQISIDSIEFSRRDKEELTRALEAPRGLILLAGPTDSGKTTALYGCVNHVAGPDRKVMSVEDPVEFHLPWVVQVQVRPKEGVTFTTAMRSFLRSDPDVIVVGEIRGAEPLNLALQSTLTGHLVLTSIHSDEAAQALKRMVEIGAPPFLVADAASLIIAKRLVRRLCRKCSTKKTPSADLLDWAKELCRKGGVEWDSLPKDFAAPVGCANCGKTGFVNRNVIAEALKISPEVGAALRRGASVDELRTIAVGQGMTTIAADGVRRAAAGETTLDEVRRVLEGV